MRDFPRRLNALKDAVLSTEGWIPTGVDFKTKALE